MKTTTRSAKTSPRATACLLGTRMHSVVYPDGVTVTVYTDALGTVDGDAVCVSRKTGDFVSAPAGRIENATRVVAKAFRRRLAVRSTIGL